MSRRKQVVATYGRHRKRVVSVDLWSSGEHSRGRDLFASFSSSATSSKAESSASHLLKSITPQSTSNKGLRILDDPKPSRVPKSDAKPRASARKPTRPPQKRAAYATRYQQSEEKENQPTFDFSDIEKFSLVISENDTPSPAVCPPGAETDLLTSTPQRTPSGSMHQMLLRRMNRETEAPPLPQNVHCNDSDMMCLSHLSGLNLSSIADEHSLLVTDESKSDSSPLESVSCYNTAKSHPQQETDPSRDLFEDSEYSFEKPQHLSMNCQVQVTRLPDCLEVDEVEAEKEEEEEEEETEGECNGIEADVSENDLSMLSAIDEEEGMDVSRYTLCSPDPGSIPCTPVLPPHLEELRHSCHSMKQFLTPVRSRRSGQQISAREKLLLQCEQDDVIRFTECITPAMMKKCVKIGEGVYGEVYSTQRNQESVALKIIPIDGDLLVNDEQQKTCEEILSEIVISRELSALQEGTKYSTANFVHVNRVSLVEDSYPQHLLQEWDRYHKRKGSENDRPDAFPDDQLFVVFEFENCGQDLESYKVKNASEAFSIISQVALALAVAEESLQFEHRDLHWGNVLVRPTSQEYMIYRMNNQEIKVKSCGIKVSIIDFTLSRLSQDGCSVYTDLSADPTLFQGSGDYQFDVYRLMQEVNNNEWKSFNPYTNVLWIHYLVDKLLNMPTASKTRIRSQKLRALFNEVCDYQSATHLLEAIGIHL